MIVELGDEEQVDALTKSASYISSVRVFDGASKEVKSGKLPPGEIAVYVDSETFIELGKETNALVIGHRPRAAVMGGGTVENYWDDLSEAFKLVQEKAEAGVKFFNAGLEFLLYLPETKGFAVMFFGNKSGRRESPKIKALVGRAATITSDFVERPKNSWWCAKVSPCTTPFDLPDNEAIRKAIEIFKNPEGPATEPEDGEQSGERVV